MSIAAYRRQREAAETPRELERRAFMTVIGRLTDAKEKRGQALVEACHLNTQLWTTLLVDLCIPENGLPQDLKARLISIGIWVLRYTPDVMAGKVPVEPLISVNRSIAEGLSTVPAADRSSPEATIAALGAAV